MTLHDYPLRVGSMLLTMVDPTRGNEKAYNRWYERDHFYAGCMIGPYLFGGSRWVAPRSLKDLRFGDGTGQVADPIDKGSYVSIYWVEEGHHQDHFGWARTQVFELYKSGRGFMERVHAHTILADQPWTFYRDEDPVPIELAHDHRYEGLAIVAIDRAADATDADLIEFQRSTALPALMSDSPIAVASSWKPESREGEAPMDLGTDPGGPERQTQVFFLDEKPEASWNRFRAYAKAIDESGFGTVRWAGPFYPTIVGTDTYIDELW